MRQVADGDLGVALGLSEGTKCVRLRLVVVLLIESTASS